MFLNIVSNPPLKCDFALHVKDLKLDELKKLGKEYSIAKEYVIKGMISRQLNCTYG